MAAIPDDGDEFDKLLVYIHNNSDVSHWYDILGHPKNIARDGDDSATKTTLKQLNNSSLQLRCNLRTEQYFNAVPPGCSFHRTLFNKDTYRIPPLLTCQIIYCCRL